MNHIFTSEFFAGNRARLRQTFTGTAPIVITANGQLQRNADNPLPFRQDSSFWYLTGVNEPNITLVMDKDREYLIVPEREEIMETFDGKVGFDDLKQESGVGAVYYEKEGWKLLGKRLAKAKHVATLAASPSYIEHYGMYANPARAALMRRLKQVNPAIEPLDLRVHLMRLRSVKQPQELQALRSAIDITMQTITEVSQPEQLLAMTHEYELEAAITAGFRKRGAAGNAFAPIVAAGKNACTIHYVHNNGILGDDQLIVVDVGAEVSNYAADITRTLVRGKASKRQKAVVAAVEEVLQFGFRQLKPGVAFMDCEQELRTFMGEKLRELGLIKTVDSDAVHRYYPHAPHFLGLDVHDVGDYHEPLKPGMVLTVEPGIYIPEEGIGVRIEDDVLITETGVEVLTEGLPRLV